MLMISAAAGVSKTKAEAARARKPKPNAAASTPSADADPAPRPAEARSDPQSAESVATDAPARAARPFAPLIAQLIATRLGLPQTRQRRRGAFAEAAAVYRREPQPPKRSRGAA